MKSDTFDMFDVIFVIIIPNAFKVPCNTSGMHYGVTMWLFHVFMKGLSTARIARFSLRPTSTSEAAREKERILRTFLEVRKRPLQSYATNDAIADTDVAAMRYTNPSTILPT